MATTTVGTTGTSDTKSSAELVGALNAYITEHHLAPGDRLPPIRELAARFGTTAGALREALHDAQDQGLVQVRPRAGAFVAAPPAAPRQAAAAERIGIRLSARLADQELNLFHLLDARETLERQLVAEAARKRELPDLFPLRQILENMASLPPNERQANYVQLDMQFHVEIARLSGNAVMVAMLRTLLDELTPHLVELRWSRERYARTDRSHARLYSALVAGNAQLAQREIGKHLQEAYNTLLDQIRLPPGKR